MKQICEDLAKEHDVLDVIVADLDDAGWNRPTPAVGWTIRDEISHLAYFDERARIAATDPEAFQQHLEEIMKNPIEFAGTASRVGGQKSTSELLAWWRKERKEMLDAFIKLDPKKKVPWYGPPMSTLSKATARLMETWAHGQDIVDTLGATRPVNEGIRNIAHIGFITFGWSYINRQMTVPDKPVRVELATPFGEDWLRGPEDAENAVRGPIEDFCLVVTQRRNVADTQLVTTGEIAAEWMTLAQCFAGPPTSGPEPGAFPKS